MRTGTQAVDCHVFDREQAHAWSYLDVAGLNVQAVSGNLSTDGPWNAMSLTVLSHISCVSQLAISAKMHVGAMLTGEGKSMRPNRLLGKKLGQLRDRPTVHTPTTPVAGLQLYVQLEGACWGLGQHGDVTQRLELSDDV